MLNVRGPTLGIPHTFHEIKKWQKYVEISWNFSISKTPFEENNSEKKV